MSCSSSNPQHLRCPCFHGGIDLCYCRIGPIFGTVHLACWRNCLYESWTSLSTIHWSSCKSAFCLFKFFQIRFLILFHFTFTLLQNLSFILTLPGFPVSVSGGIRMVGWLVEISGGMIICHDHDRPTCGSFCLKISNPSSCAYDIFYI